MARRSAFGIVIAATVITFAIQSVNAACLPQHIDVASASAAPPSLAPQSTESLITAAEATATRTVTAKAEATAAATAAATTTVTAAATVSAAAAATGADGFGEVGDSLLATPTSSLPQPSRLLYERCIPSSVDFDKKRANYIDGYPDGSFRPDANVTRAEAAAMLYRLVVDDDKDASAAPEVGTAYNDVAGSEWYGHIVSYMTAKGLMRGYPDGYFRPEAYMTRAELAAVLCASFAYFFDYTRIPTFRFPDVPTDHWAFAPVSACAFFGLARGYADGTFRPDEPITRAEAVTLLNRSRGRGLSPIDLPSGIPQYTDLDESHWAYSQIMEASTPSDADADAGEYSEFFVPGELIVEMNEKTEASVFTSLFPELRIAYIVDLYEKAKSDLGDVNVNLSDKTIFLVRLEDIADESVFAAIDILSLHPSVKYAEPNGPSYRTNQIVDLFLNYSDFEPGVVLVTVEPMLSEDDFMSSFSDMPIEAAYILADLEEIGLSIFTVELESKTHASVYEAIELFLNHPNVIAAESNNYFYIDHESYVPVEID